MEIIKRKKGKETYYYLHQTFREGKKVRVKEKYLGKEIPKNIEKTKTDFIKEFKKNLYGKLEKIRNNFQKEWKKIPQSAKLKELEEISIAFTYNTNAIEGSTITLEETREIIHDKIAPNKSLREIKEIESHNKVFLQMLKKKEKITKTLLLDWHQKIFGETKPDISGKFRDYLVRVGPHLAPDWQDIEGLMKKLIQFIKQNEKMNIIELSARAHYRFEKIHPFGDGNGRTGRLLMNFILWYNKYPMLIIENKKKKSYYKALERGEEKFVDYSIRRYLAVHKKRYLGE